MPRDLEKYKGCVPFDAHPVEIHIHEWEDERKSVSVYSNAVELIYEHSGELTPRTLFLTLGITMPEFKQVEKFLNQRGITKNSGKYEYPFELVEGSDSRTSGPEITDP